MAAECTTCAPLASDPDELASESSTGSRSPRACARVMPQNFNAKTGVELVDGVVLGRELGAGVQAKVFDLVRSDGSSIGKVLKLGHADLSHRLFFNRVAGSMMDLQHEWELGMVLKAALEQPDGTLPGFTRTCDCMVVMHDERRVTATFQGLMMERLNGWPAAKRLMDPAFHNIHYVREMLFQVLSALDRAQRALGFNHADLGLNNVMEHYPTVWPEIDRENKEANAEALAAAATGRPVRCTTCAEPSSPLLPGRSSTWTRSSGGGGGGGCMAPPPIAGFSVDSDGKLNPLGPHVEFKIIDYGVGELNETLAQAAGGHEPEETLRRIQDAFAQRGIPLGAESKRRMVELVDTEGRKGSKKGGDVRVKGGLHGWKLSPFGKPGDKRFVATPEAMASTLDRRASALAQAGAPRGPVERMYRKFWERKGDVFHLLLAVAVALDDRVWPKEDERDVQLFASLVHHVTGIKIRAYFASADDPKRIRVMGKSGRGRSKDTAESLYGARVRCFTAWRRTRMFMAAHMKPFNSGLLAGEALVSPFFGIKGPPHAELPVCVEAAFPFRPADEVAGNGEV